MYRSKRMSGSTLPRWYRQGKYEKAGPNEEALWSGRGTHYMGMGKRELLESFAWTDGAREDSFHEV